MDITSFRLFQTIPHDLAVRIHPQLLQYKNLPSIAGLAIVEWRVRPGEIISPPRWCDQRGAATVVALHCLTSE